MGSEIKKWRLVVAMYLENDEIYKNQDGIDCKRLII